MCKGHLVLSAASPPQTDLQVHRQKEGPWAWAVVALQNHSQA
jgi:hypothetical protein